MTKVRYLAFEEFLDTLLYFLDFYEIKRNFQKYAIIGGEFSSLRT